MNKNWKIVVSGNIKVFEEFASALQNCMIKIGYKAEVFYVPIRHFVIDCEDKNLIFIRGNKNNINKIKFINYRIKIFYQLEQEYKHEFFKPIIDKTDVTFHLFKEYYEKDKQSMKKVLCPCGWHQSFKNKSYKKPNETIDVFTFGSLTPYRDLFIKKHGVLYKKVFDNERDEIIKSSKINLVLKAQEDYSLPLIHCLLVMCKNKFLMVDKMKEYFPFIPNKHFVVINNSDDIKWWLENEKERIEFAKKSYNDIKKNYKMIDFVYDAFSKL